MSICNYSIETTNPENWELRIVAIKNAVLIGDKSHIPIGNFDVGLDFTSPFLLVEAENSSKKSTWKYAGTIRPLYFVGSTKVCSLGVGLRLGKTQLIVFKDIVSTPYSLQFDTPDWFKNLVLKIWEYRGATGNVLIEGLAADFNQVFAKLNAIEAKLGQETGSGNLSQAEQYTISYFTGLL
jgi:hypothetical protein